MKVKLLFVLLFLISVSGYSQKAFVVSPNQKVNVEFYNQQDTDVGEWYLKVSNNSEGKSVDVISKIDLGLSRSDQDFSNKLKSLKAGNPLLINEQYPTIEGLYSTMEDGNTQQGWGYPALFNTPGKDCWYLIHEADLDRSYCGSKLSEKKIFYDKGCDLVEDKVTQSYLYQCSFDGKQGIKAAYWNNPDREGEITTSSQIANPIKMTTAGQHEFASGVKLEGFSAIYETEFVPKKPKNLF